MMGNDIYANGVDLNVQEGDETSLTTEELYSNVKETLSPYPPDPGFSTSWRYIRMALLWTYFWTSTFV